MQLSGSKFAPKAKPVKKVKATGAQTVSADIRTALAVQATQTARRQATARAAPVRVIERAGVYRYFDPSRTFTPGSEERAQSAAWREGSLDIPLYTPDSMILSDSSTEGETMHTTDTRGLSKQVLAQAQFLTWMQNKHPDLYAAAINEASNGRLSGMGQMGPPSPTVEPVPAYTSIVDKIVALGSGYLTYTMQKKIINMNIERAKMGLPPIDIAAAGAAPVVQTEVNISPAMIASLKESLGGGMQQIGLLIAVGLGAFLLFGKKRR